MSVVRAAVVQAASGRLRAASRRSSGSRRWPREAAADGAQLVVFPEAFVGGYPKGVDFGARVGQRTAEGRE